MGKLQGTSEGSSCFETRLLSSIQTETTSDPVSDNQKQLFGSSKTKSFAGVGSANGSKEGSGSSSKQELSRILQSFVSGSKTRKQMATSNRSQCCKYILHVPPFKMETAEVIRASLQAGKWVASIDLTDAYFHVPIHQKFKKYLRFHVQGQAYQFRALPFGIATAPLEFTRVVKEVKFIALSQGVRIHQYLDDWLVRSKDPESCARDVQKLVNLVETLGWIVNLKKSELKPTQDLEFLGYQFNLREGLVYPNQKKLDKLRILAVSIFQGHSTTPRKLMSLIGVMASMEKTVPLGRIHMRPFQWFLKTNWQFPQSLDKVVPISQLIKDHLAWWMDPQNLLKGSNLQQKEHNMLMFTDASEKGWGAHLYGKWGLAAIRKKLAYQYFGTESCFSSPETFTRTIRKKIVLVSSDNSTVVSYINKEGGTHSFEMCALMWRILAWSNAREIHIRARHIPGNLNVIADSLSRRDKAIQSEWSLHPQVFQEICQVWHKPMVDLFATSLNAKLPTYVSPVPDDKAWQIDALNISWEALDAYAFCPVAILPQLVQKMITYRCRVIVIAPGWPGMPWFWDLVELSVKIPLRLPQVHNLLKQPFSLRFHKNLEYLNLHAWYLDSFKVKEDSLLRWQIELRHLRENPQDGCMIQGGPYFKSGPRRIRWMSQTNYSSNS